MKKLFIVLSVFLVLVGAKPIKNNFTLLDYFEGDYCSYTENAVCSSSLDLGFCFEQNKVVEETILIGESLKIKNFEPIAAINKLGAKIVKTEYLDSGLIVFYAYSPLIRDEVKIDDKKVNLQIAQGEDITTIGWPLILGSF